MKRFFSRAAVAGLSAALVAGAALVAAPAANAATIGTLSFSTTAGALSNQDQPFSSITSAACPAGGTNFQIFLSGGNITGNPAYTGNTAGATVGGTTTAAFTAPMPLTLAGFALGQGLAGGYLGAGTYTMTLTCRAALNPTSLGDFVGTFTVTGSGATSVVAPVLPITTTTTTVTGPAAGATNAPSTFSATVSPATAVGSVAFSVDGGAAVPAASFTGGVATSAAVSSLSAGAHTVVATFTGGSSATATFSNSTSAPFTHTVAQATATSATALSLSSASVAYPASVTATAIVTNAAGSPISSGTVQFNVDGVAFGSPVSVNATGTAVSAAIAKPAHLGYSVTAVYSGATVAGVAISGSTSAPALFDVTAPQYAADQQNIQTSITAGTLTISTPYTPTNPLVLPAMTLNATATEYKSSAAFMGISVTDTRPGNLPYTLSATSSTLTKFGGLGSNNEIINAQNVGLTALGLISTNSTPNTFLGGVAAGGLTTGQNFTAFDNPAAAHLAAGVAGTAGLAGGPAVLHANSGLGTTVIAGSLSITAPTNTLDGTYNGTVTFTILGA